MVIIQIPDDRIYNRGLIIPFFLKQSLFLASRPPHSPDFPPTSVVVPPLSPLLASSLPDDLMWNLVPLCSILIFSPSFHFELSLCNLIYLLDLKSLLTC